MSLISYLLDLLFPPKCPFCRKLLDRKQLYCAACEQELPRLLEEECHWVIDGHLKCVTPFWYKEPVDEAIRRFKFHNARYYDRCFGQLMASKIEESDHFDVITWVPMLKKKQKKRGYNQAQLLAKVLSEETGIKTQLYLEKWKENAAQSTIHDDEARRGNTEGVYRMLEPDATLSNLRILLVDDVITTGSTLLACKKVLKEAGAAEVYCIGLARARK